MLDFEQYKNYDMVYEQELMFLELAHLDELEIKFDLIEYSQNLFYFYKDTWLFNNAKNNKYFFMKYNILCDPISKEFSMTKPDLVDFMEEMMHKYFGLKEYKYKSNSDTRISVIDNYFR